MKRKFLVFIVTAVSAILVISSTGWTQNHGLTKWSQAIRYMPDKDGFNCSLISFERRHLVNDIYEYTLILQVGEGEFDKIGIHRVIKERWPGLPEKSRRAVMMTHGDSSDFRSGFLMSTQSDEVSLEDSPAIYLAQRNIDVWGIDLRWTFVPDYYPETEIPYCWHVDDACEFMKDWNMELHLKDIRTAVRIARVIRGLTGSDFGKLFMLGHSSGARLAFAYANEETQLPWWEQSLKGIIPVDIVFKFDPAESGLIDDACTRYHEFESIYSSGTYYNDEAVNLKGIAFLAATKPDEPSPVINGLTNQQASWFVLSATYLTYETPMSPPVPYYHYCAGTFDEYGIPTGLRYTNSDYMIDFAFAVPSFQSLGDLIDGEAIRCSDITPFDDYLNQIEIPVFYVGAAGGFGAYGEYVLDLLASADKQSLIVRLNPVTSATATEFEDLDYGHIDLLFADNAELHVWEPIFNWIESH